MFDSYAWAGGREAILRLGPAAESDRSPLVLIAPALFEEANRTRAFTLAIMRGLAARGIGSALPDLPATNESLVPTEQARLADWRAAFAACVGARPTMCFAIRGGGLVDGEAAVAARCHLSPVSGQALVRDLVRARRAASPGERLDPASLAAPGPPVELAGNHLSRELIADLETATPRRADRVLRLESEAGDADARLAGRPLWRASEPDVDAALADAIADDLARWARSCVG